MFDAYIVSFWNILVCLTDNICKAMKDYFIAFKLWQDQSLDTQSWLIQIIYASNQWNMEIVFNCQLGLRIDHLNI